MQASYWQEGEWVLLMCFLDEIKRMFPQLANQPSRVLPADTFTDHALKNQRSTVLRKRKKGKLKAGQFLFIIFWLFTRLLILCCSSVFGLHFLLNNFLCRVWNMQFNSVKSHQRLGCGVVFVANVKKVKGAVSQYLSKLEQWEPSPNWVNHKNNSSKH